jgi:very-short-patch-repair endonuclease
MKQGVAMSRSSNTTTGRVRGTTPEIEQAAREMREHPTQAEAVLWQALSGRKLCGLKFRRQHPVGSVVLDFYCPACKLAIELDGAVHDHQRDHDASRTDSLMQYGYRVIRFQNEEVLQNLDAVLERIEQAALHCEPSVVV